MKSFLRALSVLLTLAVIAGAAGLWWTAQAWNGAGPLAEERVLVIARGHGFSTITGTLHEQGMIAHPLLFRVIARLKKEDTGVHAGEYAIPAHASMAQVLAQLSGGAVVQRRVTVREGLTSWQVVQIVNAAEGLEGEITDIPPEGTLLPETYSFVLGDTRAGVIAQMQAAMQKTVAALWEERQEGLPLKTPEEAVILAAIVEKETGVNDERARVAGVFINRLRLGMPLQSDPTVIYAMTMGRMQDEGQGPIGRRLLRRDLQMESPYNTYKNAGLTPTPIANPGRAAIAAVLQPEDHGYIYFVADGQGGHAFGKTLAEHNANVAQWRKIRRAQEKKTP